MKFQESSNIGSPAAVCVLVILIAYLGGYFALRQSAAHGTIFLTSSPSGTGAPSDYRGINLNPHAAKWVHRIYSPLIVIDRKWTGTVVTVNVP